MPKVSIIVPIYNVEKYLDRCLQSLLNQTLKDIELILVDDGSPDRCPEMCDEYARKDSRIKVIHKKNEGLGLARNTGLEIANGDYVAFVDSDDFVDINMYQQLYEKVCMTNSDAVFCGFKIERSNGSWNNSNEVAFETEFKDKSLTDFMLDMVASAPQEKYERRYYMSVWHAIYCRDIIKKHNLKFMSEREVASEDIPFQVDFLKIAKKIMYIPSNLYYYCLNSTSLTATYKKEKYDRFKKLYYILKDKLKHVDNGSIRADRFFIGYCRTQLHHLLLSSEPNKLSEIKRITTDDVWDYFRQNYPVSNFKRTDHKFMYWLILHKCNFLLMLNSIAINRLKRSILKNKC